MKLIAFILTIVLTVGIAGEYGVPFDAVLIYYLILSGVSMLPLRSSSRHAAAKQHQLCKHAI